MTQVFNKMRIDVKSDITDIITVKQDDANSRFLDVHLFDGSTPIDLTGEEVRIYMQKPDGTEIFNNGEITEAANGRCQFELTAQALGAFGALKAEISIWHSNTQILTTQTFHIFITKSLRAAGSIESSNEYGALVVLFQNLYESLDLMTEMVQAFGVASEVAASVSVDTFWGMLEALYTVNYNALKNASVSEVLDRIGTSVDSSAEQTLFGKLGIVRNDITAKSNELHRLIEQYVRPGSIVLAELDFYATTIAHSASYYSPTRLVKITNNYYPPASGMLKIRLELEYEATLAIDPETYVYDFKTGIFAASLGISSFNDSTSSINNAKTLLEKPIGYVFIPGNNSNPNNYNHYAMDFVSEEVSSSRLDTDHRSGNGNATKEITLKVEKGFPLFILVAVTSPGNYNVSTGGKQTVNIKSVKILGEVV